MLVLLFVKQNIFPVAHWTDVQIKALFPKKYLSLQEFSASSKQNLRVQMIQLNGYI